MGSRYFFAQKPRSINYENEKNFSSRLHFTRKEEILKKSKELFIALTITAFFKSKRSSMAEAKEQKNSTMSDREFYFLMGVVALILLILYLTKHEESAQFLWKEAVDVTQFKLNTTNRDRFNILP